MKHVKPFLLWATVLCFSAQSWATAMFLVGLQELSTGADNIVQAKVTAVVTRWNSDSTVIFTYIRANIVDDLLGDDEDNEIIIRQPGGTIGTRTLALDGTATFRVGETDVLFLSPDPVNPSTYQTMGLYQGKYRVYTAADLVERVAQDEVEGVALYFAVADIHKL